MDIYEIICSEKDIKDKPVTVCYGTSTPISDKEATTSLRFKNEITPDNLLIAGLLIFIALLVFTHFISDLFFLKKIKVKQ